MKYFEFIESYKRGTNVLNRYRIPKFCERYKRDSGTYDLKSQRFLPRTAKQRDKCVNNHEKPYCLIWKKIGRDSLFNGVEERRKKIQTC